MAAKARGKKESFDCLLPTGLLITVEVSLEATFDEVKKELWAKAQRMPLFAVLNVRSLNRACGFFSPPYHHLTLL
jgi:hypothetical protein